MAEHEKNIDAVGKDFVRELINDILKHWMDSLCAAGYHTWMQLAACQICYYCEMKRNKPAKE